MEIELCQALIHEGDIKVLGKYKIRRDYFRTEQQTFDYILRHHARHGVMPNEVAVRRGVNKPDFVLAKPDQPLTYWCQEIINREQRAVINKAMERGAKLLGDDVFDVNEWRSIFGKVMTTIASEMSESADLALDTMDRVAQVIERYRERTEDNGVNGIKFPWEFMTNETGGMQEGDVTVISADTGVGKSWLLILLAFSCWVDGKKILFVSKEMAGDVVEDRFHSLRSKLAYKAFRQGRMDDMTFERWEAEAREMGEKGDGRFIVVDDVKSDKSGMMEVEAKIEEYKPDIIFIDAVYLISDDNGDDDLGWKSVGRVIIAFKRLLSKHKIPGVVTTQNRDLSNRSSGKGRSAAQAANSTNALAYTREIGRIATLLMVLYQGETDRALNQMRVYLPKVREGERLSILLNWNFDMMDFSMKGFVRDNENGGMEVVDSPNEQIDWDQ